jgi:ATP-dependent DNA ligase
MGLTRSRARLRRQLPPARTDGKGGWVTPRQGTADAMPHDVKPMLATLTDRPFDRAGWLFELKWDGYRAIAEVNRRRVRLYSRNLQPFEGRVAPLVRSLHRLGHEAVLDGDVVFADERGRRFTRRETAERSAASWAGRTKRFCTWQTWDALR